MRVCGVLRAWYVCVWLGGRGGGGAEIKINKTATPLYRP